MTTLGTGNSNNHVGSFGRVKLAKNKKTGRHYALKMLKKSDIVKSKHVDHVMNENMILNMLDHPFIVLIISYRSVWKGSVKIQDIFILYYSLYQEENYLRI